MSRWNDNCVSRSCASEPLLKSKRSASSFSMKTSRQTETWSAVEIFGAQMIGRKGKTTA